MPAYSATGNRTAIYPGDQVAVVNNAATDAAGITTTQQLAIGPVGNQTGCTIIVTNSTNHDATEAVCASGCRRKLRAHLSGFIVPASTALPTICRLASYASPSPALLPAAA